MTGQEPAARLKEQRPELRMLYTSGYNERPLRIPDEPIARCAWRPNSSSAPRVRAIHELLNKN